MSWMKRRTPSATPSPGLQATPPPVQMYNPNQHSNSTQDWQQQQPNNWYNQASVQSVPTMPTVNEQNSQVLQPNAYWQRQAQYQPQHQPQQQQQQAQQQQQQQQYQYGNNTLQSQQNNYYQQSLQATTTHHPQPQQAVPAYEYNNMQYGYQSNMQPYAQSTTTPVPTTHYDQSNAQQPPAPNDGWNNAWGWGDEDNSNNGANVNNAHNANTVANNDESWNWNVEEHTAAAAGGQQQVKSVEPKSEELFPKMGSKAAQKPENLETVPLLPTLPASRRIKSEALTPQWSIESQVSQESSDDILQTSESDKLFSRSSTISHSPVSGHQTPLEAPSAVAKIEPTQFDTCENKEIVSNIKEEDVKPPPMLPPSISPASGSTSGGENPFKRASSAKHRTPPPVDAKNFYLPTSMNQSVNLETVPDNSEHPQPEVVPVPLMENNEVAPLNERNQYLETGQLSDENDALPPPGLSRMVLGQFGQGEANEPPPGLSRMVLGQTEGAQSTASPPVGLHRMVPGESSSPEVRYEEEEVSDPELQLLPPIGRNPIESRSATIGADTPPAPPTNGTEQVERDMDLDGANTQDGATTNDVDTLATSVRDLTVGENTSDGRLETSKSVDNARRLETDSEVERASSPSQHERKERRHKEDGAGRRDKRYSPDYSRDTRDGRSTRDGRDSRDLREKSRTTERRTQHDRGFDDDTDYYSDRERDRWRDEQRPRDDGDKKKHSSLRRTDRERDNDRRTRSGRDERGSEKRSEHGRRPRGREYYYDRYSDDYHDSHRSSRPSSRSDSMHDSFYSRGNDRDQRHDRYSNRDQRHRDPYNMYKMPGYPYDPYNPYYQQYQYYLENLRRTDPAAYAELYRKYYGQSGAASSTYTQEEKTSVHSGRSSTNDDLAKERYLRQSYYGHASYPQMGAYYREPQSTSSAHNYTMDESSRNFEYTDSSMMLEDTAASQRLTPAKFSTAHAKASIASGRLVRVLPHYPMDGQSALVELERIQELLAADEERVELEQFPGPLIRGVTHKKTIIEYCNNKIRDHDLRTEIDDPDSYVLMWELLILLIRQNGMVVGADIAELLMKDRNVDSIIPRPSSAASNSSGVQQVEASESGAEVLETTPNGAALKEEYVTRKFREYLLYGSVQQALEWAMKHSLWGHALFLASKLDKRTYAKVMTRFANGLPMNDPLQTLYQLLSGHLPAAVTSVSDEKWGDWRPHLAMILSNTMQRPELDRKAITTLGDTLMSRGSLYAAQFCYLMAEVGFSRYGQDGKLVLLGANHNKAFLQFAHNEAIHMTEIYEYACSLNDPAFQIPEFQAYKYLLATRLADRGFLETALAYAEQVSAALVANPTLAQPSLINKVCDLADRLKYYDPADYQDVDDPQVQAGGERPDQPWLQSLRTIQQQYTMGLISHESVNNLSAMTPDTTGVQTQQSYDHSPQNPWASQTQFVDNQQYIQQPATNSWQQPSVDNEYNQQQPLQQEATSLDSYNAYQEQSWNNQPAQTTPQWSPDTQQSPIEAQTPQVDQLTPQANDYWNNAQAEEAPRPQISMPNQSRQQRASVAEDNGHVGTGNASDDAAKKSAKGQEKKAASAGSAGWFGGIWSKLALRPKNQMKLPDDKNPAIVWDQDKKRWINRDEDNGDGVAELRPPPKMSELMRMPEPQMSQPQSLPVMNNTYGGVPQVPSQSSQPQSLDAMPPSDAKPPLPTQNIFKMQRGRSLKKSYVDVFNPGGKPQSAGSSADFTAPSMPATNAASMNFFVPAPMDPNAPVDFLTPSGMPHADPNGQMMSRWSSASSLSREVQSYMRPKQSVR